MPTLSRTIEDTSPLIVYSPEWSPGLSWDDHRLDKYSQGSYMKTSKADSEVSFKFYGTGLQLFGSKRQSNGLYQITIDEWTYKPANAYDVSGIYQTSLFSSVALTPGLHTVWMKNLGNTTLDLDFLTWQSLIGREDEPLLTTTSQDSDSSFIYQPPGSWTTSPNSLGTFSGGSGHSTSTSGATVEINFQTRARSQSSHLLLVPSNTLQGDGIALYGPVGPNYAAYSAEMDRGVISNFSAQRSTFRPHTMLFYASNLGHRTHTLLLRHESPTDSQLNFAVDYAEVFTTPSLKGGGGGGKTLSTGGIVGVSIGGAVLLVALGLIAWFMWRRKSRDGDSDDDSKPQPFAYQPVADSDGPLPPPGRFEKTARRLTITPTASVPHSPPTSPPITPGVTSIWQSTSHGKSYGKSQSPPPHSPADPRFSIATGNPQYVTVPYTQDGKYRPDLVPSPLRPFQTPGGQLMATSRPLPIPGELAQRSSQVSFDPWVAHAVMEAESVVVAVTEEQALAMGLIQHGQPGEQPQVVDWSSDGEYNSPPPPPLEPEGPHLPATQRFIEKHRSE